jgi:hypothetical protein
MHTMDIVGKIFVRICMVLVGMGNLIEVSEQENSIQKWYFKRLILMAQCVHLQTRHRVLYLLSLQGL